VTAGILIMAAGCTPPTPTPAPPANQPPVAYIDSILPSEVTLGEEITFEGHGTDTDGTVVAYRWRSSKDDLLSSKANFSTSSLSEGEHIIFFKVQDNNGTWSTEERGSITVLGETVAPMVVTSFAADPPSISEGDSSTLSWDISNAATVVIDHGVGSVDSVGSTTVSPEETTTYKLTATNPTGSIVASTTVEVSGTPPLPPAQQAVLLVPIADDSGYVRDTGQVTPKYIYVGDDTNNISLQAFMSFDISGIPAGATITKVVVDFSDYTIYGDPFSTLGYLRGYAQSYGALDSSDYFTGTALGALIRYNSLSQLVAEDNSYVKNALQAELGSPRFQMRLQFNDTATNGDWENDIVAWTPGHYPTLKVTYTLP